MTRRVPRYYLGQRAVKRPFFDETHARQQAEMLESRIRDLFEERHGHRLTFQIETGKGYIRLRFIDGERADGTAYQIPEGHRSPDAAHEDLDKVRGIIQCLVRELDRPVYFSEDRRTRPSVLFFWENPPSNPKGVRHG